MIKITITKIKESSGIKASKVKLIHTVDVDKDGDWMLKYFDMKSKIEDVSLTKSSTF